MKIWRVAEFIDNFERCRLLPRDPIRVDRIHNREFFLVAELTNNFQRVVKISVERDNLCAVGEGLN